MIEFDKDFEKPIYIVCDFCKHLIEKKKTCRAFPEGIPEEILMGKNKHSSPLADQGNDFIFDMKAPV
jgi:hypothetical protein